MLLAHWVLNVVLDLVPTNRLPAAPLKRSLVAGAAAAPPALEPGTRVKGFVSAGIIQQGNDGGEVRPPGGVASRVCSLANPRGEARARCWVATLVRLRCSPLRCSPPDRHPTSSTPQWHLQLSPIPAGLLPPDSCPPALSPPAAPDAAPPPPPPLQQDEAAAAPAAPANPEELDLAEEEEEEAEEAGVEGEGDGVQLEQRAVPDEVFGALKKQKTEA